MDIFRTLIVQANQVELAREVGASYGAGGEGMFVTPLSSTGLYPATHYISSGLIGIEFASMLESPQGLVEGAASLGVNIDLATAEHLLSNADISDEQPFVALERLGLKMISDLNVNA